MKKKLLLDVDDVICVPDYLYLTNKYLNTNYTFDNINTYYMEDLIDDQELKDGLNKLFLTSNMYEHATLKENALEIIKELSLIYDIYICSAAVPRNFKELAGNGFKNKYDYLIKTLPFLDPRKFIFTNEKSMIKADIQIDDKITNLQGDALLKLLFTSYHNKNISQDELDKDNIIRVDNWEEIGKVLIKKR